MSGAGKTTIAVGLMAALRAQGLRVQPFKAGPDYIDPAYHRLASGRPSRNIDSWLLSRQAMMTLVSHACADADIAIIEGIMGLYDGRRGLGAEGSTAEIAKWLRAPVVLVLDIARTAQSAGAVAMGFHEFDREVQIIGVVLNNVANAAHLARATEAVETGAGLPVLGHMARDPEQTLPEQHPTLVPACTLEMITRRIGRARRNVETTLDVGAMLSAARAAWPFASSGGGGVFPNHPRPSVARIAYLHDEAFDLYQPDNLDLLSAWGAELIPASPLRDSGLPEGIDGIYAGPGFAEVFAEGLCGNASFLQSVRNAVQAGVKVYAECGGLSYMSEGIEDSEGRRLPMAGVVPGWSKVEHPSVHLGYATAATERDSLLGKTGRKVRGYEFYLSRIEPAPETAAFRLHEPEERFEGFADARVFGSNVRLHFGSEPGLARGMVEACIRRIKSEA